MDANTFMWVDVLRFGIDRAEPWPSMLSLLTGTPEYQQSYYSPFAPGGTADGLHGQWAVNRFDSTWFVPSSTDEATGDLDAWANRRKWRDGTRGMSAATNAALRERIFPLFETPEIYRFAPPSGVEPDREFDPHFSGFNEWIALNRDLRELRVVVATDD